MTLKTICAALAVAAALPAAAQDDLTLDLSTPPPKKEAKETKKPGKGKAGKGAKGDAKAKADAGAGAPDEKASDLGFGDLAPAKGAASGSALAPPPSSKGAAAPAKADATAPAKPADALTAPAKGPLAPATAGKQPAATPAPTASTPAKGSAPSALTAPATPANKGAAPAALTTPPPAPANGATAARPAPGKGGDVVGLELLDPKGKEQPKDLDLDVPTFDDLDLKILQDVSLCIFPFIKEDKLNEGAQIGGAAAKAGKNLETIQKIFSDVAKSSKLLKDAVVLGKDAPSCGIEDVACMANIGKFTGCAAVLAGRSTREDNGFTLRARMVNVKSSKLMGRVNQVMATDDDNQVAAWAEGQACRALKVDCKATLTIDADRPEMKLLIDNKPLDRKPSATALLPPEVLTLTPGVYKVRVTIGQRSSREEVLALRRSASETVYARQLADGGIPLTTAGVGRGVPPRSVELAGGKWTKPVGYVLAGLGVAAAGFGVYEGTHAQSMMNDANTAYSKNGGFYTQNEIDNISSARSANSTSKVALAVGAGLVVVGAVFVFAF
jgi:hypothetical protein